MPRVELAHPDKTEVGEIGVAVRVAACQHLEGAQMIGAAEGDGDHTFVDHRQHERNALKMKRRLGQNGLAGQQRLGHPLCQRHRPVMVDIIAVGKCNEKTGVSDALHFFEKPLRVDSSRGPRTDPAKRMKD